MCFDCRYRWLLLFTRFAPSLATHGQQTKPQVLRYTPDGRGLGKDSDFEAEGPTVASTAAHIAAGKSKQNNPRRADNVGFKTFTNGNAAHSTALTQTWNQYCNSRDNRTHIRKIRLRRQIHCRTCCGYPPQYVLMAFDESVKDKWVETCTCWSNSMLLTGDQC